MVGFLDNNLAITKRLGSKFATIIFVSMILGFFSYVLPGVVFCIFLTFLFFYLVNKNTAPQDRRYVLSAMAGALILRLIVIIAVQYYCFANGRGDIFGDAGDNLRQGWDLNNFFKGVPGSPRYYIGKIWRGYAYNVHGKTFFNGIFFMLFGKSIIPLKYINFLCVMASGWLVYDLCRKIHSGLAGKAAMSTIIFWPTLFLWSITDLKESHFIFTIITTFWCLHKIIIEKNIKNRLVFFMPLIICAGYAILLRINLMLPLLAAIFIVIALYFGFRWCRYHKINKVLILLGLVIGVFLLTYYREDIYHIAKMYYEKAIGHQYGFITSGGWNFNLIGDLNENRYTIQFFLRYLFSAWFHFFTEPLPWHLYSFSLLAIYPMMIIWYGMLFLSIRGVINLYRAGKSDLIFPPLVFLILYSAGIGMSVANIGTLVRFRDAIMPIIAIFASCSLIKASKRI